MARNGTGQYVAPNSSWNPAIGGVLATAGDWQALLNDLSAALTQSVSRDGQSPMQGNLNLSNNKITGLAAGTGAGDAATWAQLFGASTQADIASAATTDIGVQNTSFLRVTGTTTITSFGTNYRGPRFLTFAGAVTLTQSSTLVLPGGANITTAEGDSLIVIPGATSGTSDKWIVVAYQKAQNAFPVTSGSASVALSSVEVTLTSDQSAYPVITFTGTLTANVNVVFPNDIKSYRILNNTTGAFTVTCKTSAGTGVVVPAGSSDIFCNGTNIIRDLTPSTEITSKIEPVTASVASNALTVTLNPTTLDFRSATLGSGTVNTRAIATALSAVVPLGATLGTTNAVLSKVTLVAIDNAGTVELAVCNGSLSLDESTLISTTALSADADSASVVYSTTARTNVPFRVVGFIESTQATAGTWATAPSKIQGAGGQALQASGRGITSATAVTASGTSVDFTGIPSWVRRVTVMFSGVSTNGTSLPRIQIGTSGVIQTSGYLGSGGVMAASVAVSLDTGGFVMSGTGNWSAATTAGGTVTLNLMDSSTGLWSCSGLLGSSSAAIIYFTGGSKALSGTLDRIRITTVNGTDVFDAGTINILMEG